MNVRSSIATILMLCAFRHQPLHAELLIIKLNKNNAVVPLDSADHHNIPKIENILLEYQWPMSAAHVLDTPQEKEKLFTQTGDLFTAGKPNAEEIFIDKKIKEVNPRYHVIFFPTVLYEYFAIISPLLSLPNPLLPSTHSFTSRKIIEELDKTPENIRKSIKDEYRKQNQDLYTQGHESCLLYINRQLVTWLLENNLIPKDASNAESLSNSIKTNIQTIAQKMLAIALPAKPTYDLPRRSQLSEPLWSDLDRLLEYYPPEYKARPTKIQKFFNNSKLLTMTIDIEYTARSLNKAILIRGAKPTPFKSNATQQEQDIIASTLDSKKTDLEDLKKSSYSVSFGSSLLAGMLADQSASAFYYLSEKTHFGFSLFIDKKEYVENYNDNLFYIPGFSTIAGLSLAGEWWHPRTKVARISSTKPVQFTSIGYAATFDPTIVQHDNANIVSVVRDPLKHAALFSAFVEKNCTIIELKTQTTSVADLLKNQHNATTFYTSLSQPQEAEESAKPMRALQAKQE